MRINAGTDRFVKPDLVIEDGTTEITHADGPPTTASYTAVLEKQEGKWNLVSLHEMAAMPPSNFEHLKDLAWIVGDWTDEADKNDHASVSFTWADNQNFLVSTSKLTLKDIPVSGACNGLLGTKQQSIFAHGRFSPTAQWVNRLGIKMTVSGRLRQLLRYAMERSSWKRTF